MLDFQWPVIEVKIERGSGINSTTAGVAMWPKSLNNKARSTTIMMFTIFNLFKT